LRAEAVFPAVPNQEPQEGYDTGEICLLCGNRRLAAAQQVFLYFARRGLGEFANERNPTWRFEVSKIVSRELDDFGFVTVLPGLSTTNACAASPHFGCGMPTTETSSTAS
jgi:hypothetical protein